VLTSFLSSCRAPRVPPVGDARAPCVPRLCRGRLRIWAPMPSEQSKHYARAFGLYACACIPWQRSRSVRGVGRNQRRGAKNALPICGHPAHGWAPPAVGTPGEGGDDHRQRRRAAPWSLPERQPAPWAVRGYRRPGRTRTRRVLPQAGMAAGVAGERAGAMWPVPSRALRLQGSHRVHSCALWPPQSGQSVGSVLAPPAPGQARRDTRLTLFSPCLKRCAGPTHRVRPELAHTIENEHTGRSWLLA
jgi:hypothetical protein